MAPCRYVAPMWLHSSQFLIAAAVLHSPFLSWPLMRNNITRADLDALIEFLKQDEYKNYPQVDHIHFFGFYIGNYPALEPEKIDALCEILNAA